MSAIAALLTKRTELARGIDQRQSELVNLLSDLNALTAPSGYLIPTFVSPEVIMKPLPPRSRTRRARFFSPEVRLRASGAARLSCSAGR